MDNTFGSDYNDMVVLRELKYVMFLPIRLCIVCTI